jgi:hypothetical protein
LGKSISDSCTCTCSCGRNWSKEHCLRWRIGNYSTDFALAKS